MSEVSFSRQVKEEMISKIDSSAKGDACLYGMLLCANELSADKIRLLTETQSVADFFTRNTERICGGGSIFVEKSERGGGVIMQSIEVTEVARSRLLSYFSISDDGQEQKSNYPKKSLLPQMISGMFLACGSLSDPEKRYHMEFCMPKLSICNRLGLILLEQYGMLAKHVERKGKQVLYFKESDNIIDMIALMGATSASFELTNVKIYKDMRNKINREVNCVNANIEKSIKAAERQIADIELIDERIGIGSLPENLREIAALRYENPDYNLGDLGAALEPPISRSGANHRLKKLAEIAQQLREKDAEAKK